MLRHFIMIPIYLLSFHCKQTAHQKRKKRRRGKKITSCILWFRCATFLIYASTKAPTRKNIQCGWSGILEVGLSDGAPAGSHNLTSCKPHVAKHVSKWPDRSNVSHVLSSWEPWKKREKKINTSSFLELPWGQITRMQFPCTLFFQHEASKHTVLCSVSVSTVPRVMCRFSVKRSKVTRVCLVSLLRL